MQAVESFGIRPVNLRCEGMSNPLGIDVVNPRLSWSLESSERAQKQAAYQIQVASRPELLERDEADLWDSGRVESDESLHIVYQGRPLTSRLVCYWRVKVWPEKGSGPATSDVATWEMGLLEKGDWSAQWIGVRTGETEPLTDFSANHWMWAKGAPARGAQEAYFRRKLVLPDVAIERAWLLINADSLFRQYTNGIETTRNTFYVPRLQWADLTYFLQPGENLLTIEARRKSGPPAGVIARLIVRLADGQTIQLDLDETWKASPVVCEGWQRPDFDDSGWEAAVAVAPYGRGPWKEQVIEGNPEPPAYLRKPFVIEKEVARARLYATALGIYQLRLNGQDVTDERFSPGWTDYRRRIMVQAYDVTAKLARGENVLGAIVADGWYAGYVGMMGRHKYGGYPLGLLAQLEIEYTDGTKETVATDGTWMGSAGPLAGADLLMGEIYDARLEMPGWDAPGYQAGVEVPGTLAAGRGEPSGDGQEARPAQSAPAEGEEAARGLKAPGLALRRWRPVEILKPEVGELVAQVGPPVRVTLELKPVAITHPEPGVVIFDLGQNMVGTVQLTIRGGAPGQRVVLRYGEMLEEDGRLYTLNLRSARQTDVYICRGDEVEVFEPRFTFHGFRYVEVRGYPGEPTLDSLVGKVIHSDTPIKGSFECSHPMVNQLQSNIVWGQRGNFLSVPTDCPQRDERLGWLGDAQVFIRTACFNADTSTFFTKWMIDVEDAQRPDGAFTDVAPYLGFVGAGTAAWGDAGVIVPWTIYLCYGDTRIIERHYDAMRRWIRYLEEHSDHLIRPAQGYGDWLSVGADTPKDVIATAYFAYSTRLLSRMARAIGKEEDAAELEALFQRIKAAFNERFVSADGRIKGETQTAYLLGLRMDLLSEEHRKAAVRYLVQDIEARGGRLSTGFVGCSYLLPELTDGGELDLAYRLLLSTEFPSWGYTIEQGATTMWERWDSYKAGEGFQDEGMNSFNHYAFGSVGEWLYRYVAGIDVDPGAPGYKRIIVRPRPGGGITWVRARYESVRGPIAVAWRVEDDTMTLDLEIPANTTAEVHLPTSDPASVEEGGKPAATATGVREIGGGVFEVGSGRYEFRCRLTQ